MKKQSEVADFFGMSLAGIRHWIQDSDPMPGSPGNYDLSAITQWKLRRVAEGGLVAERIEADIRVKTVTAQQKELELERDKGKLLELEAVELWAATALIELREMLMALPEMLATSSPPELRDFVRAESDRHVRDCLTMTRRRLEIDQIDTGESVDEPDDDPLAGLGL